MNSLDDVEYRLNLARGFLKEAEEDFHSPKTHEPGTHLNNILSDKDIPAEIRNRIKEILPDFLILGIAEHFMTDYGDESSYTLPWDLFDKKTAGSALTTAKRCKKESEKIIKKIRQWRSK